MFLRLLVHQFLRQFAQQKVEEEFASRMQGAPQSGPSAGAADAPASAARPPVQVAVLFALGVEADELVNRLEARLTERRRSYLEHTGLLGGQSVLIAETGVGGPQAADALEELLGLHQPSWIVSAGFAGALSADVRRGQIVMPDHILDGHGNQLAVGFQIDPQVVQSTQGLVVGRLLTVDRLIRSPDEKQSLGERFEAVACDMETFAVAQSCRQHHLRFLAARVISDSLDDCLSPEMETLLDQSSWAAKLGAAAGAIFQRPAVVKDMWKLREEALRASTRLASFLQGVLPQLEAR